MREVECLGLKGQDIPKSFKKLPRLSEKCIRQFSTFVLLESMDDYNWRTTQQHLRLVQISRKWMKAIKGLTSNVTAIKIDITDRVVLEFEVDGHTGLWTFYCEYYESLKAVLLTAFNAESIKTIQFSICVCLIEELWFDHAVAVDLAFFLKETFPGATYLYDFHGPCENADEMDMFNLMQCELEEFDYSESSTA